ncbi:sugar kinase [Cupriavidus sp. amp6]|uniref:sugar kinase n=1 Tax=Cupriavidus sp. amp6 TaxID=388051 RepID=UPI000403A997|nr:sugar kinase [Cupriavidus sp. amp6]
MTHDLDVVTLGEAMLMLVADQAGALEHVESFRKRTAGAETNVAIGLSRLGLKVGWASRLGSDSMARYLLAEMQREGVDCSQVVCEPGQRTGFQFKGRVDDGSDPPVEYHRRDSAASRMGAEHLDVAWLYRARHLHVTGVFPALAAGTQAATRKAIASMRGAGRTISFDPNLRPTLWATPELMRDTLNDLAQHCDWVFPGIEEGRFLTGHDDPRRIAAFYRERGASLVVVKLGAEGAYFDGEGGRGHIPACQVERVVDTVGAGDGFAVGVISALLEGRQVVDAVRRGAWIGARAVQVPGDTEGLPTRQQLETAGY